jgi:hypothetical protein
VVHAPDVTVNAELQRTVVEEKIIFSTAGPLKFVVNDHARDVNSCLTRK